MGAWIHIQNAPRALSRVLWEHVSPVSYARHIGVRVGQRCRLGRRINFGSEPFLVTLGDHVSVTGEVIFLTHDGGVWVLREEHPDLDVIDRIWVGDNSFIGTRSIILPGVRIGRNCVIGAGSVVTKSIPDNSVAAGVPARVLGSIDDYRVKSLARGVSTKALAPRELRAYLTRHFGIEDS